MELTQGVGCLRPSVIGSGQRPWLVRDMSQLIISHDRRVTRLRMARPERGNSLNAAMVEELTAAVDAAERAEDCRTLVLEGAPGVFCTGMDFQATVADPLGTTVEAAGIAPYYRLLTRLTRSPKVVVALVDGKVMGGGVGLAAASDFVLCSPRSEFSLPEALWGLLPCCVLPFLLRRIGFQKAYTLSLGTRPVSAESAAEMHLVDEVGEDLEAALRRLTLRLHLLHPQTVVDLKAYFRDLAPIPDDWERRAVAEITRLSEQPRVRENIANFVNHGRFPWEASDGAS